MSKTLGLRFSRQDVLLLRKLADTVRSGEMTGQSVNVFEQAARAAESGEPMVIYHDDPIEVVEMAALYLRHGCHQPVIEQLNGT